MSDASVPQDTAVVHADDRRGPHPVLTVPEMLSEIFIHFVPPYPECLCWGDILHSPTLLTHICGQWREIALSIPQLWRAVGSHHFSPEQGLHGPHNNAAGLETWLTRSLTCALSLEIFEYESSDARVSEILAAAIPHRARWEHLALEVKFEQLESSGFLELDVFPLLRHLDLNFDNLNAGTTNDQITIFRNAPLLRRASLQGFYTTQLVVLPWAQLTSLALAYVYLSRCSYILAQTPNLIHCELGCIFTDDGNTLVPAFLPRLASLTIGTGYSPSAVAVRLSESLTLPALLRLRIAEDCLGDTNPVQALGSVISQTGCKAQDVRVCIVGKNLRVPEAEYRAAFPGLCFEEGGDHDGPLC
ncbi:hypothetical protein C8R46DRAFT_1106497 [Mycena filopes]|nr:hypothetical protein C8R46DRAFT_1106497 [Mycena filopes]